MEIVLDYIGGFASFYYAKNQNLYWGDSRSLKGEDNVDLSG